MGKYIITSILLTMSLSASANTWHLSTIDRMNISSDKTLIVYLNDPNPHCNNSLAVKLNDSNSAGANWIYSALLAFKATNRPVNFLSSPDSVYGCTFSAIEDQQN